MKYMQAGGFQNNPLMRLTLALTLVFLIGFVITNFTLYFSKMNLNPASVVAYYNGSEEEFRPARSFQSMLEVTHGHLPMMALVLLLLTHLVIFAPFPKGGKVAFICVAFGSGLLNEGSSWLVRFVDPAFAPLKVAAFVTLQGTLIFLLAALALFLIKGGRPQFEANGTMDKTESVQNADTDSPYMARLRHGDLPYAQVNTKPVAGE